MTEYRDVPIQGRPPCEMTREYRVDGGPWISKAAYHQWYNENVKPVEEVT